MAITKSLIFDKVTVNNVDLTPHLAEGVEVTVTPVMQSVLNNQALPSAYDITFSVEVLNTLAANTAGVYGDSASEPQLVSVAFSGAAGASTLTITNVYVTSTPNFEGERTSYVITGAKRVANISNTVTVT